MEKKFAFWSDEAAARHDSLPHWELEDGRVVQVTAIMKDREGFGYLWKDKEFLGRAVRWVRGESRWSEIRPAKPRSPSAKGEGRGEG